MESSLETNAGCMHAAAGGLPAIVRGFSEDGICGGIAQLQNQLVEDDAVLVGEVVFA